MPNQPYTTHLADWCFRQSWWRAEAEAAYGEFFRQIGDPKQVPEEMLEGLEILMNQWIIYQRPTLAHGKTPLRLFTDQLGSREFAERAIYQGFAKAWVGAFLTQGIEPLRSLTLLDLATGQSYTVAEHDGTIGAEINEVIFGQMLPLGDQHLLGAGYWKWPPEAGQGMAYDLGRMRRFGSLPALTPQDIARIHIGHEQPAQWHKWQAISELDDLFQRIGYGKRNAADVAAEFSRLERGEPLIEGLLQEVSVRSRSEANEVAAHLINLWNAVGTRPLPRGAVGHGPMENAIIHDLLAGLGLEAERRRPRSRAAAEALAKGFRERYLATPQADLGGQTPWQAILEERQRLGNPDREFGYHRTYANAFIIPNLTA